jgi:hypothetical protein
MSDLFECAERQAPQTTGDEPWSMKIVRVKPGLSRATAYKYVALGLFPRLMAGVIQVACRSMFACRTRAMPPDLDRIGAEQAETGADADKSLRLWASDGVTRMHVAPCQRVSRAIGSEAGEYDISLRPYGWNAVSGQKLPVATPPPREIGLLFVATARSQALATQIARSCNPLFFHFPVAAPSSFIV